MKAGSDKSDPSSRWDWDVGRIASGTTLILAGFVFYTGLTFIYQLVLARWLQPADLGRYFLAAAVISVLLGLCTGGAGAAFVRFVAILRREEALALGRRIFLIVFLVALGIAILTAVLAPTLATSLFHDKSMTSLLRLAVIGLPFGCLAFLGASNARGWGAFQYHFLAEQVALPGSRLLVAVLALAMGAGVFGATFAFVLGFVASAAIGLVGAWRLGMRLRSTDGRLLEPGRLAQVMRFSAYRWGTDLLQSVLLWADLIILGFFWPPSVTGVYGVATRVVLFVATGLPALNLAIAPFFARRLENGPREDLRDLFELASRWGMILTLIPLAYVLVLRSEVLSLFGGQYVQGALALSVLAGGFGMAAALGPSGTLLNMSTRNNLVLWDNLISVALNIGLNLILIPNLGMLGAAAAWSSSKIMVNVLQLYQISRYLDVPVFRPHHVRTVLAFGVTFGAALLASMLGLAAEITVLSIAMPIAIFLTRTPDEVSRIRSLLSSTRRVKGALRADSKEEP